MDGQHGFTDDEVGEIWKRALQKKNLYLMLLCNIFLRLSYLELRLKKDDDSSDGGYNRSDCPNNGKNK